MKFIQNKVINDDKQTFYYFKIENNDIKISKKDGVKVLFSEEKLKIFLQNFFIRNNIKENLDLDSIVFKVKSLIYNECKTEEITDFLIAILSGLIEEESIYSNAAALLMIEKNIKNISKLNIKNTEDYFSVYKKEFINSINKGLNLGLLDARLSEYNLEDLANYLDLKRDKLFDYMGIFTLYKRYFIKVNEEVIESPQGFWMRVAMGLALNEEDKQTRAKEFYDLISQMLYTPGTPTLSHSGLKIAQLSSCYLNVSNDDLGHIFKTFSDIAQLSKWCGGIGTSWSHIRACGATIKKLKIESQGVIPFIKIVDDIVVAMAKTSAGIRKGAIAVYLEVWHYDVEDFLDLRKNTGDHRRRAHDLNTALWIPDLFMKRLEKDEDWTLFSPEEVSDLLKCYGKIFEEKYLEYEKLAEKGSIKIFKKIPAKDLWKKMIMRLFETGHPWITFKDPCNIRSPQDHCGIINSSNLCTEITLNTSENETAVCNLGSLNLEKHSDENGQINFNKLKESIKTAVRILDNVIDIGFYPTKEAEYSNKINRPIGLGIMGLQDLFYKSKISFLSLKANEEMDFIMEFISYYTISASADLAIERGKYASFDGSKWNRKIFPIDTLKILEEERGEKIEVSMQSRLDWKELKDIVSKYGIRNSNLMAIAPTATISTISGCYPSIEPAYKNIYVKANISGEFTIINKYLVNDLKKLGLWNSKMRDLIKYYDGSVQKINEIPAEIKELYLTAFEVPQERLINLTALRGKWIDQSQSHNVFFEGSSGKELSKIYIRAWKKGLKTTYYLRTLGKSQIEKATLSINKYGFTQLRENNINKKVCSLEEGCESCQ